MKQFCHASYRGRHFIATAHDPRFVSLAPFPVIWLWPCPGDQLSSGWPTWLHGRKLWEVSPKRTLIFIRCRFAWFPVSLKAVLWENLHMHLHTISLAEFYKQNCTFRFSRRSSLYFDDFVLTRQIWIFDAWNPQSLNVPVIRFHLDTSDSLP